MAHDVFISYSHTDKPTADAACATLESRGIRCWIAPRDVLPGDEYASALVGAIHSSRLLVLVFSSGANQSPQVLREVERAVSKGLPILPLRIEDVAPSAAMEYYISSRHWLDALTTPLEQHLVQLADTVTLLLARSPGASPPAPPAPAVRTVPPPVIEERAAPVAEAAPAPTSAAAPAPAPAPAPVKPTVRAPDPALAPRRRVALAGLFVIAMLGASSRIWTQLFYMFGWTTSQSTALSMLRLLSLAAGFVAGGTLLRKAPPRRIATLAGVLYGLGTLGAGVLLPQSAAGFIVYLALACLAGFGTGLGFIVVITTVLAWFPERRGMLAGLAIAALVVSTLPGEQLTVYFGIRGLVLIGLLALIGIPLTARLLREPEAAGITPAPATAAPPRIALWILLFLNTLAGSLVAGSLLSGMRSMEYTRTRYAFGFAIALGLGAIVLGALSDRLGRRRVILSALGAQVLILVALPLMVGASLPLLLLFMLSSGGGFSIASAITADHVGPLELGKAFGLLLTAWVLAFLATGAVAGLAGEGVGLPYMMAAMLPLVALVIAWRLPPTTRPPRLPLDSLKETP